MRQSSPFSRLFAPLVACAVAACGAEGGEDNPAPAGPRQLSVLRFEGAIYVDPGTSDFKILERVRQETLSIFPGLRRSKVMVTRREVAKASIDSFREEVVTVVGPDDARRPALRIRFRYAARPDVAPDGRVEIPLAVLHRTQGVDPKRVLRECAPKASPDRDYGGSIALVFDPTEESCKAAIQAEQAAIDAARAKLASPVDVPAEEADRLYLPVSIVVEPPTAATAAAAAYPLYEPFDPSAAARPTPELPEESDPQPETASTNPERHGPQEGEHDSPAAGEHAAPAGRAPRAEPKAAEKAADAKHGPEVVDGPGAVAEPPSAQKDQGFFERLELPLDILLDPKFLAVWLSLLMVYPILRAERKRKT